MFACGNDHVMRKAISNGTLISGWASVPSAPACATQPSALVLPGGTPRDMIGIFYRSTSNRLIELWYSTTDVLSIADLSNSAGLGTIKGMPIAVDRDAGSPYKVAIVTIQTSGKIVSMDLYSNAWHRRSVLGFDGLPASAYGLMAVASYGQFARPMVMLQVQADRYYIFDRSSWTQSYTAIFNHRITRPGTPTFGAPHPSCAVTGCALYKTDFGLAYSHASSGISGVINTCNGDCAAMDTAPMFSMDGSSTYGFSRGPNPYLVTRRDYSFTPPYDNFARTGLSWYNVSAGITLPVGPYPEFKTVGLFASRFSTHPDALMYVNDLDVVDTLYPGTGVLLGP